MAPVGKLSVEVVTASVTKKDSKLWEKALTASVKVELRDGNEVQKDKTKQGARTDTADGYSITYGEKLLFDVAASYPGELRVQLCRTKNSGITGGTIPIANAGIFVKNIVTYIEKQKSAIYKNFTLFSKESGQSAGIVTLKLNYIPAGGKAYAVPTVVKEAYNPAVKGQAPAAAAVSVATAEEGLEDHVLAEVDQSHDHVTVKSHGGAPPVALVLAAAALAGLLAFVAASAGGAKKPAPAAKSSPKKK